MFNNINITALVILLLGSTHLQGQNLDSIHTAMLKLKPMVGEWSGNGWVKEGENIKRFRQTESISYQLGKSTLLINGKGFENDSLVFDAMAVISYNTNSGKYRFNSFLADGKYTDAEGWFDDERNFNWQFTVPGGGTVRYTIALTNSTWNEKGGYSPPNSTSWYPFMEMNLTKNK